MIPSVARTNRVIVLWIAIITAVSVLVYQEISNSHTRNYLANQLSTLQNEQDLLIYSLSDSRRKITGLLVELYQEKERAYVEIQCLKDKIAKLQFSFSQIINDKRLAQSENERLNKELASLKEELRLWEGKVKDLNEKKLVLIKIEATKRELAQRAKDIKANSHQALDIRR